MPLTKLTLPTQVGSGGRSRMSMYIRPHAASRKIRVRNLSLVPCTRVTSCCERTVRSESEEWALLDLNQRPTDYESFVRQIRWSSLTSTHPLPNLRTAVSLNDYTLSFVHINSLAFA